MSDLSEIITFLALALALIWLPGAVVIKLMSSRGPAKPRDAGSELDAMPTPANTQRGPMLEGKLFDAGTG